MINLANWEVQGAVQAAQDQDLKGRCPRLLFLGHIIQMTELTEQQIPHRDGMRIKQVIAVRW